MSLEKEIQVARKNIVTDGYDMSIGELINLYRDHEIEINPEFQRLFRWDLGRKTQFIESILLGIPIPPIFVFQNRDGNWELIDGLQRLSTIFEFCGILRNPDGKKVIPSVLNGTSFLPSLDGKTWQVWNQGDNALEKPIQLQIRRARLRIEILLSDSDENAKYEMFQRLNTGGSPLSEQEVRNCIAVMINPDLYRKFNELSQTEYFKTTTKQTKPAQLKQSQIELILRFFTFRNSAYKNGLDVHEYLTSSLVAMAKNSSIDWIEEEKNFRRTFSLIDDALGSDAFTKWDGSEFKGRFLMSLFEVISLGISKNIDAYEALPKEKQKNTIIEKSKLLWSNTEFVKNSGAGISGTTRLAKLLPLAKEIMKP